LCFGEQQVQELQQRDAASEQRVQTLLQEIQQLYAERSQHLK
jgi:hypothetical protein